MTPDIARLIMFLSIVTIIQSAIDYYVYRKFKSYLDTIEVTLPLLQLCWLCLLVLQSSDFSRAAMCNPEEYFKC